jgi:hypothetical protein
MTVKRWTTLGTAAGQPANCMWTAAGDAGMAEEVIPRLRSSQRLAVHGRGNPARGRE